MEIKIQNAIKNIKTCLKFSKKPVLAWSGGKDSMALLDLVFNKAKARIVTSNKQMTSLKFRICMFLTTQKSLALQELLQWKKEGHGFARWIFTTDQKVLGLQPDGMECCLAISCVIAT
jgi:3'-phosphoadenosine 5'-phosphosulfate sulfotransferase (PAPS reductase)/FAD synthetase